MASSTWVLRTILGESRGNVIPAVEEVGNSTLFSLVNQTVISAQGLIACSISAPAENSLVNCLYHFCSEE